MCVGMTVGGGGGGKVSPARTAWQTVTVLRLKNISLMVDEIKGNIGL